MATKRFADSFIRDHRAENENEVRDILKERLSRRGAAKEMATSLGCSDPYLSLVKNGVRPLPQKIAAMLGFRRVIRWERMKP